MGGSLFALAFGRASRSFAPWNMTFYGFSAALYTMAHRSYTLFSSRPNCSCTFFEATTDLLRTTYGGFSGFFHTVNCGFTGLFAPSTTLLSALAAEMLNIDNKMAKESTFFINSPRKKISTLWIEQS